MHVRAAGRRLINEPRPGNWLRVSIYTWQRVTQILWQPLSTVGMWSNNLRRHSVTSTKYFPRMYSKKRTYNCRRRDELSRSFGNILRRVYISITNSLIMDR